MAHLNLDLVFHENSDLFPVSLFIAAMGSAFLVITLVTSPHVMGWPARRSRRLSVAINAATLIWMGPTAPEFVAQAFRGLFGKQCMVDVSVFAGVDTPENIAAERSCRAELAGHDDPHGFFTEVAAEDCAKTGKAKERIRNYRSMAPSTF